MENGLPTEGKIHEVGLLVPSAEYKLLNTAEVVNKWDEAKTVSGMRFGGVGYVRVENQDDLAYVFVSGNELPVKKCWRHKTNMSIERVKQDTNHNIERTVYYYCYKSDYIDGVRWECEENIYPEFKEGQLRHLMSNPVVADRPKLVILV